MDLLPIPPKGTNKINGAINLANDGGSKSNTGYMNQRDDSQELPEEPVDELTLSSCASEEVEEEKEVETDFEKFIASVKKVFNNIYGFIRKSLGLNRIKVENIYKDIHISETEDI